MDSERIKLVSNRMAAALQKELLSWNEIEKCASYISERPFLHKPINLHKHDGLDFEFKQMYDPEKAAYIQDEISDLLNAERYA